VSGRQGDQTKDIHCSFKHDGVRIDVHMANAVSASPLDEALAASLRR
jgi:hypothetical protein